MARAEGSDGGHLKPRRFSPVASGLLGLIRIYQLSLSSIMGRTCRHLPSCSDYTSEAIRNFGAWPGLWMGLARFSRCHPFGSNGLDPVPARLPDNARWYTPWRYGLWTGRHITERFSD
ncbi:putative membrane protein insertion efficiency factor [Rhodopseudomonas julia]|uniref:Putative membrane protein insertion efficiency factor n=1 Tax=Rhodopseudomonas julia TaxID=200617 RepID=A0ABU0C8M5_9BRAD|nr:membrane protein insertion efficiency factor YidD [Rhodopseudomonas julia]MDQ0326877.1 putative membrane protein insertion efficiency factor [Rhodopseudomonas julia]